MNIIVCLKQILDPEFSASDVQIDPAGCETAWDNVNFVTNLYCENALETALHLRRETGGSKITVLAFGPEGAEDTLRKAMAMKADEAILVVNDGHPHPDSLAVAQTLAAAVRKLGAYDLVLVGRESLDRGTGQTGGLLAEELELPCISFVEEVGVAEDHLVVRRQTDQGWELLNARPPLVLTVTGHESNLPRIPKPEDLAMAASLPITKWTLEDLKVNAAEIREGNSYYEIVDLSLPVKDVNCEFVTGDSLEERVEGLARRIVEAMRPS